MAKSKKVRMPAGIRNKLTAAIAMLLVSSIMMVSSTYAWFTLSTAPEVTGITTSVGANGNLEMALLTTETYNNLNAITSAVGNSSANTNTTVSEANITWGNLVDLSDAGYGLQNINLQPARLNVAADSLASLTSLLQMPVYGKDGRVSKLSNETYSTVYTNSGWAFDADNQTYGVRAIGANNNLSPQDAGLIAAKTAYTANLKSAQAAVQSALSANGNALASALTALAIKSEGTTLTTEQQTAVNALITASGSALNYIDAAYKQVLLAAAASQLSETTAYEAAVAAINGAATYQDAVDALNELAGGVNAADILGDRITVLNTQKGYVAQAQTDYNGQEYLKALSALVDSSKVTINGFTSENLMIDGEVNSAFTSAIINDRGAVVAMPEGSGLFAYVASVAGNYSASCKVDITQPVTLTGVNATMKTDVRVDNTVATAMNALRAAVSAGGATVLSDTFGYALDFAFRTNAAESYLLLQTAAAQRVYTDSTSAATQGGGATMTFAVTKTEAGVATLTNEQVKTLMGAIRVGFINPVNSSILGIAALTDIVEGTDGFTGDLYLHNYDFDANGVMILNGKKTEGPAEGVDPAAIMKLNQSEAARLTVVVWLDGDMVDNADVANAAQSLVGSMNLQFSSSAELIPMQNTALQNMTITYTEVNNPDYAAGLYEYNGVNVLKTGYKIYNGSDNTVYYSNDETNYTKLTVMNYTNAMTPLTVSVTGTASIVEGNNTTLKVTASAGTIKSVTWTNSEDAVATIPADDTDAEIVVTAVDAGTTEITAAVTVEFGAEGAKVETNATVKFNLTVTEPAPVVPDEPETGDDENQQTPTSTVMTNVTVDENSGAALDGDATFVDKTISFKLKSAENDLPITEGLIEVTVGDETVEAAYSNDVWSASVNGELTADTAVTIDYSLTVNP